MGSIIRLLTYQAVRTGALPALLASAPSAPADYPLNGGERLVTTKVDAAAAATLTYDNTYIAFILRHQRFTLLSDLFLGARQEPIDARLFFMGAPPTTSVDQPDPPHRGAKHFTAPRLHPPQSSSVNTHGKS